MELTEVRAAGAPVPAPGVILKAEAAEVELPARQVILVPETGPTPARIAAEAPGVLLVGSVVQTRPILPYHQGRDQPILVGIVPVASAPERETGAP